MLFFKKLSLVAVGVVASLPVLATPTLRLSDNGGGTWTTIIDNGVGDTLNTTAGVINFSGAIGVWTINVSTASTSGSGSTTQLPTLSLVNFNQASAAGTLLIEFSEIGFRRSPFQAAVFNSGSKTGGGYYTTSSYNDGANGLFGGVVPYTNFSSNLPSDSDTLTGGLETPGLTPYSLTLKTGLVATSAGIFGSTIQLTGVPEPGFYGALAIGLSGLFVAVARRRTVAKA